MSGEGRRRSQTASRNRASETRALKRRRNYRETEVAGLLTSLSMFDSEAREYVNSKS